MVWQTFLAWFGLYLTLVSINWKTCSSEMNRVEINRVWKIFKEKGSKPFVVCEINAVWKEHCDSLFTNPNQTLTTLQSVQRTRRRQNNAAYSRSNTKTRRTKNALRSSRTLLVWVSETNWGSINGPGVLSRSILAQWTWLTGSIVDHLAQGSSTCHQTTGRRMF